MLSLRLFARRLWLKICVVTEQEFRTQPRSAGSFCFCLRSLRARTPRLPLRARTLQRPLTHRAYPLRRVLPFLVNAERAGQQCFRYGRRSGRDIPVPARFTGSHDAGATAIQPTVEQVITAVARRNPGLLATLKDIFAARAGVRSAQPLAAPNFFVAPSITRVEFRTAFFMSSPSNSTERGRRGHDSPMPVWTLRRRRL